MSRNERRGPILLQSLGVTVAALVVVLVVLAVMWVLT